MGGESFNERIKREMEDRMKGKRQRLIIRWSIVTAGTIGLFWTIWYLITGSVPAVTRIEISENWTYVLPFSVSRWWDILFGPIWSTTIILFFNNKIMEKDVRLTDFILGLAFGPGLGLVVGIGFSLVYGLGFGLIASIIFNLGFNLAIILFFVLISNLIDLIKLITKSCLLKTVRNWLLAE